MPRREKVASASLCLICYQSERRRVMMRGGRGDEKDKVGDITSKRKKKNIYGTFVNCCNRKFRIQNVVCKGE